MEIGRAEVGARMAKAFTIGTLSEAPVTNFCIFPYLTLAIASGDFITSVEDDRKIGIKNSFAGTEICY